MASVENVASMIGVDLHEAPIHEPVPVEHLDYEYVRSCQNVDYLARILTTLKSGREGRYPDLETVTEKKIRQLDASHRVLRFDAPLMTKKHLPTSERSSLEAEFEAFEQRHRATPNDEPVARQQRELPPVRGRQGVKVTSGGMTTAAAESKAASKSSKSKTASAETQRIAGSDFRGWDKYDVDAALTELDNNDTDDNNDNNDNSGPRPQPKGIPQLSLLAHRSVTPTYVVAAGVLGSDPAVLPPSTMPSLPLNPALRQRKADHERLKGNECMRAGDYAEAAAYYTRSVSLQRSVAALNNRCLAYLKLDKHAMAESDANSVLGMDPDNVKALLRRGSARNALGKQADAESDLERCCQLQPGHKEATRLLQAMSQSPPVTPVAEAVPQGRPKGTRVVIQEVEDDSSDEEDDNNDNNDNSDTHGNQSQAPPPDPASASPSKSTSNPRPKPGPAAALPAHVAALKAEGRAAFQLGQYASALALYQQAEGELLDDATMTTYRCTLLTNQATCALKLGQPRRACDACSQALALDERNVKAYLLRASASEQREKFVDAVQDYRAVLTLAATTAAAQQGVTRCLRALRSLGQPIPPTQPMPFGPAASVGAEAATPLSPTGSPSLEANVSTTSDASETPLLAASISSGTPVAATKPSATPVAATKTPATVAASTRKAQQTYDDLKAQGNTCVKQQQYAAAIEHYTRCIELEPTVMAAFNNRALCFLRLNKPVRAAADVTVVLAREPSNVKALFRLGQACAASGRVADAREALRKVLVLEPKNTAARRAYEQLPAEAGGCSATVVEQASPSSNADQGESASGGKATGKRTIVIEEVEDDSDDSDDNDEPDRDDEATAMAARLNAVQVEHASMQAQVKEMQTAVDEREAEVQALQARTSSLDAGLERMGTAAATIAQDIAEAMQADGDKAKGASLPLPTTPPTTSVEFLALLQQHANDPPAQLGRWLMLTPPSKLADVFSNQLEPWMIETYVVAMAATAVDAEGDSARSAAIGALKRLRNVHRVARFAVQHGLLEDTQVARVRQAAREVAEVVADRVSDKVTMSSVLEDLKRLL